MVSHEVFDQDTIELQKRVAELEREKAALQEADYLKAVKEATGWSVEYTRFPDEGVK